MATATTVQQAASRRTSALLGRNFVWCLGGNYVFAACQALMVIVIAKLGTAEMLGQFALGLAISTPLVMLFDMQLRAVQAADAAGQWEFRHCLALRVICSIAAAGIASFVGFLSGVQLETMLVVSLVALSKAVESISDVCYGLFQRHERLDLVSFSMIRRGLLAVLAIFGALLIGGRMCSAMCALIAGWIIVVATHDLPRAASLVGVRAIWPRFDPATLRALTMVAFPLGVATMLLALNQSIPRYFVQYHFGESFVGVYAALAYTSVATVTVVDALGHAMLPRLSRHFEATLIRPFLRLAAAILLAALVLGVAGIALARSCGAWLLTVVYRPEYAEHAQLFLWVMIGAAFAMGAAALTYVLTSVHVFRPQAWLLGIVATVSVAACAMFVPRFGMEGGAMASALAGLVHVAGVAALLAWRLRRTQIKTAPDGSGMAVPPAMATLRRILL